VDGVRIANGPANTSAVREVEARRTPAAMSSIRAALARALQDATGVAPTERTLDVLSSQVSLETAGGKQMFNFNFGGIKGASPQGDTANYMTREVLGGKDVHLSQGFRAYSSLDAGAHDYVAVLRARFPGAFAQAAAGNIDGFAHALKQAHYYTAPEAEYAAGLRRAAGAPPAGAASLGPMAATGDLEAPPTEFSTSAELSRVLDAVASTAARIADPDPKE
jgi:flagellum-specific peptidoglycan hydrolase FlgJ